MLLMSLALSTLLTLAPPMPPTANAPSDLLTVAEASDYAKTSSSAQVEELIARIASGSKVMRVGELGRTVEGKSIPLVAISNPPLPDLDFTMLRDKPVCFIMANIHAGEVEGKEACLELIRELALNPDHPLLKNLIFIFVPNYNADGNDKFDSVEKNRPGQVGPDRCGVRPNAQGLDLNRDYMKLEAPESQALVKFLNDGDPLITIDCHTTNGSHHRYTLTYEAPLNPSGHPEPIDFVRNKLLPEVTKRIKQSTGYDMWHYGNFNEDCSVWETYSAQPRFGGPYQGLRNQMSVLSEAYSYATYKDRIIATRQFIREILKFTDENREQMLAIRDRARNETAAKSGDLVGIRHRIAAFDQKSPVKGYENGRGGEGGAAMKAHDQLGPPKDYLCEHRGKFVPTLTVTRPYAYIIPQGSDAIVEKLRQHGIEVEPFEGKANCEQYRITSIERAEREFQGHREVTLEVETQRTEINLPRGTHLVRTAQPLGTLAVYLLEPQSEDGLATWNFFDDHIEVGKPFPILRVLQPTDVSLD